MVWGSGVGVALGGGVVLVTGAAVALAAGGGADTDAAATGLVCSTGAGVLTVCVAPPFLINFNKSPLVIPFGPVPGTLLKSIPC